MAQRGFSLLEMLVGLTIAGIVLTAVTMVLSAAVQQQRAQRVRLELAREGSGLNQVLTQELRLAGMGRPTGVAVGGGSDAPVHMLVSQQASIAFIADLARPDANYSTFGIIHDRPAGPDRIMWHTDNNGSCAPDASGASCSTADTSLMFNGEEGCASSSAVNDRTCPWASKRLRPGDFFQLVSGNGSYLRARAPLTFKVVESLNPDASRLFSFQLDGSTPFPPEWPNTSRGDAPVDIRGQGWVTTLDRVFYRFNAALSTFERRQCWGDFNVEHPSWPPRTVSTDSNTISASSSFDPLGVPGTECTPFEVVARNVESVTFSYFDSRQQDLGTPATGDERARVARVEWSIRLVKNVDGIRLSHDIVGAVRIRNI